MIVSLTIDGLSTLVIVPLIRLPGKLLLISPTPGATLFALMASSRSNNVRTLARGFGPKTESKRAMKLLRVCRGWRSWLSFELLNALFVESGTLFGSGDRYRSAWPIGLNRFDGITLPGKGWPVCG